MALSERLAPHRGRPLVLVAAALAPVIGFYGLLVADRLREPGLRPALWRWCLPLVSLAALAAAAAIHEGRHAPEYRAFGHALGEFRLLCAWFLPGAVIINMAAMVFGVTRHLPPFSRSQLVPACILLASSLQFP